jgi:hypothetical protein
MRPFRGAQTLLRGCLAALFVASGVAPAGAQGVTLVRQIDGSVQQYQDVRMSLKGATLWIVSADHKGALEIVNGACSFAGELQRCFPYTVVLHQHGRTHSITVDRGTVYLNLTAVAQRLHHSSRMLAPRNVLIAFHTSHGTNVSVQGRLDEVNP